MRLLNTTTLQLYEFFGSNIPSYYILSHLWEDGEITYQDLRDRTNLRAYGWSKVRNACLFATARKAQGRDFRGTSVNHIWIDTCCIDKTSSAELTEAINSMFTRYQHAVECFVYLKDVPSGANLTTEADVIVQSEWWTRGWTLQELLAPEELVFISNNWQDTLGSRSVLSDIILDATGISKDDFQALRRGRVSIARRMSWASRRSCTREEDEAYCLMGLFGVNMPLLYGEGRKAFQRLQAEILKESDDESIFAWWTDNFYFHEPESNLLATSPKAFWHSANVKPWSFDRDAKPYALTNKGLQLERPLVDLTEWAGERRDCLKPNLQIQRIYATSSQSRKLYAIALNCFVVSAKGPKNVFIARDTPVFLLLRPDADTSNSYFRVWHDYMEMRPEPDATEQMYKRHDRQIIFVKRARWLTAGNVPQGQSH
jgi:hypothetical protein